jgi:hypothetical protein
VSKLEYQFKTWGRASWTTTEMASVTISRPGRRDRVAASVLARAQEPDQASSTTTTTASATTIKPEHQARVAPVGGAALTVQATEQVPESGHAMEAVTESGLEAEAVLVTAPAPEVTGDAADGSVDNPPA